MTECGYIVVLKVIIGRELALFLTNHAIQTVQMVRIISPIDLIHSDIFIIQTMMFKLSVIIYCHTIKQLVVVRRQLCVQWALLNIVFLNPHVGKKMQPYKLIDFSLTIMLCTTMFLCTHKTHCKHSVGYLQKVKLKAFRCDIKILSLVVYGEGHMNKFYKHCCTNIVVQTAQLI